MARTKGSVTKTQNWEPLFGAPMDATSYVPTMADLTLLANWRDSANHANYYTGKLVVVKDTGAGESGVYQYMGAEPSVAQGDIDIQNPAKWVAVGSSVELTYEITSILGTPDEPRIPEPADIEALESGKYAFYQAGNNIYTLVNKAISTNVQVYVLGCFGADFNYSITVSVDKTTSTNSQIYIEEKPEGIADVEDAGKTYLRSLGGWVEAPEKEVYELTTEFVEGQQVPITATDLAALDSNQYAYFKYTEGRLFTKLYDYNEEGFKMYYLVHGYGLDITLIVIASPGPEDPVTGTIMEEHIQPEQVTYLSETFGASGTISDEDYQKINSNDGIFVMPNQDEWIKISENSLNHSFKLARVDGVVSSVVTILDDNTYTRVDTTLATSTALTAETTARETADALLLPKADVISPNSTATQGKAADAKLTWDLVRSSIESMSGGLKIPLSLDKESNLPAIDQTTTEVGTYYIIEDMDVTGNDHPGRVWVYLDGTEKKYAKVVDQYNVPDGTSLVLNGAGSVEVSSEWLNTFLNNKQDKLTADQLNAVNSGITSSKVTDIIRNTGDISNLQQNKVNVTTTGNGLTSTVNNSRGELYLECTDGTNTADVTLQSDLIQIYSRRTGGSVGIQMTNQEVLKYGRVTDWNTMVGQAVMTKAIVSGRLDLKQNALTAEQLSGLDKAANMAWATIIAGTRWRQSEKTFNIPAQNYSEGYGSIKIRFIQPQGQRAQEFQYIRGSWWNTTGEGQTITTTINETAGTLTVTATSVANYSFMEVYVNTNYWEA